MQQGLLPQPGQGAQQPIPQAQPQQQLTDEQAEQQYADAYEYVEQLAAHPQAVDYLVEMIAGGENIQDGLGEASAFILVRVEAHRDLDDEVKGALIGDILEVVFEIAGEMGVIDEGDVTENLIKQVVRTGTERYATMHEEAGLPVDAETAQGNVTEMEQSGLIDEAKQAMPEDADSLDQMLAMTRGGV